MLISHTSLSMASSQFICSSIITYDCSRAGFAPFVSFTWLLQEYHSILIKISIQQFAVQHITPSCSKSCYIAGYFSVCSISRNPLLTLNLNFSIVACTRLLSVVRVGLDSGWEQRPQPKHWTAIRNSYPYPTITESRCCDTAPSGQVSTAVAMTKQVLPSNEKAPDGLEIS